MMSERATGDPILAILRAERRRRGLSQGQVAVLIGRGSYQSIHQWEAGKNDPGLSNLRKWADALGYDVALVARAAQLDMSQPRKAWINDREYVIHDGPDVPEHDE